MFSVAQYIICAKDQKIILYNITFLLAEYGLPLKFIEAVDKIKPAKKKSGHR